MIFRGNMAKPKKSMGVQQCLISTDRDTQAILQYICSESNKLHGSAPKGRIAKTPFQY
jgi:hypothetical protein